MKRFEINNLDQLEAFISDESISKENRLKVFENALKDFVFYIVLDDENNKVTPENNLINEMKRIINEIKTTPQKSQYIGFMVLEN